MPKNEKKEQEKTLATESAVTKKKTAKKANTKSDSTETLKTEKNKVSKVESTNSKTKKTGKDEKNVKTKKTATSTKKSKENVTSKKTKNEDLVTETKKVQKKAIKNEDKDGKVISEIDKEQNLFEADKVNKKSNTVSKKETIVAETTAEPKLEGRSFDSKKIESIIPHALDGKKKEFRTLEVVVLVLLTCVISLIVGGVLGLKFSVKEVFPSSGKIQAADKEMQNFIKEYNYLIENYYGTIDKEELLNTAIKSMVDSLGDSYTGSLDEATANNLEIELKGSYDGLGIEIMNDGNNDIFIYGIIPNSPAGQVDLQVNDKLISVNGTNVTGMLTTDFINNVVKGSGATEFSIEIERNGEQKTVNLIKNKITLQSVSSKVYNENRKKIGYIQVSVFAANTYEQFKNELERLENQDMDSLIIDLRDNSGGHLTAVRDMISLFLDSSHVIYQTQTKSETQKFYSSGNKTKNYPIVILGNALSASASEVMIGALTEEYGAALIGSQSFGKGTVQELHTLSNGDEYKLTTKKWLTPKGVWVHNNGIKPTVEVTLSKDFYSEPTEENDNQLKAALDYLKNLK